MEVVPVGGMAVVSVGAGLCGFYVGLFRADPICPVLLESCTAVYSLRVLSTKGTVKPVGTTGLAETCLFL